MLKPLITICGTTGVGKSKLAIDLAVHLAKKQFGPEGWRGARVINADSMQVYRGLDVITNKVPAAEMEGVDHLLMGFKEPGEQYVVGEWVEDSLKLIHEMHQKKEIPIVVGGTSYWIQHLIFPNRLSKPNEATSSGDTPWDPELRKAIDALPEDLRSLFDDLPKEPPSAKSDADAAFQLHALLLLLDPPVGQRWHWKDTRKVLHSLSIIHSARRRASDIIAQQAADTSSSGQPRFRTLCFWLFAEPSYLEPRLDARVDQMIEMGLLNEIRELRQIADTAAHSSPSPDKDSKYDYTLGIYQAIGYKEFHHFLAEPSDKSFKEAVERMKLSTRQYAKKQISWIRNKLMPAVKEATATSNTDTVSLFLLDAEKVDERWADRVRAPAIDITEKLLNGESLPDPRNLSEVANRLLNMPDKSANPLDVLQARKKTQCGICTTQDDRPFMVEEGKEWERHIHSRAHKRTAARLKRIQSGQQPYPKPGMNNEISDATSTDT